MKQQIRPRARVTLLIDQQVERQRGQIVGGRIKVRIFFLVKDLQIALAFIAGLGARCGLRSSISPSACSTRYLTPLSVSHDVHWMRDMFHSVAHSEHTK